MLKFLRKYQLWILVIGGSLLMVAWLVPAGFQQAIAHSDGPVIGRIGDRKVREMERIRAGQEMDILSGINPNGMAALGVDPTDAVHWMLLKYEAERLGVMPRAEAAAESVAVLLPDEVLEEVSRQIAARGRVSTEDVRQALRALIGVERLFELVRGSPKLSDRRARLESRRLADQIASDLLFIPGNRARIEIAEPTEPEILAHFETYKDVQAGQGEFGFGYAQPPRVRLEWLTLRREVLRAGVTIDPVETYKRWSTNRARYSGEFEAESSRVENDFAESLVDDAMQRAHLRVAAEVKRTLDRLPLVQGRFRELPANWEEIRPSMSRLAQVAAEAVNDRGPTMAESYISIPVPEVTTRTDSWLTMQDLRGMEDVGMARVMVGTMAYPLGAVVFGVRELNPDVPLAIQAGVPLVDYPGVDEAGNRIYMLVTDVRDIGPPDTVDEVRAAVIADLKRLRGFEHLMAERDELRSLAVREGLSAVAALFAHAQGEANDVAVLEGVRISKSYIAPTAPEQWSQIMNIDDEAIRSAVYEAASALDPLAAEESPDAERATLAIAVPKRQGLALVRMKRYRPATIEYFRQSGDAQVAQMQRQQLVTDVTGPDWPFSRAALAERLSWRPMRAEDLDGGAR